MDIWIFRECQKTQKITVKNANRSQNTMQGYSISAFQNFREIHILLSNLKAKKEYVHTLSVNYLFYLEIRSNAFVELVLHIAKFCLIIAIKGIHIRSKTQQHLKLFTV